MIIIKVPAKITLFGEYIVSFGKEGAAISIDKWVIAQIEESKKEEVIYNNESIDLLYNHERFKKKCKIVILKSDIPIGKGLGSSSVFFSLIASAHLYLEGIVSRNSIFNLSLSLEREINPKCSGIDNATSIFGGTILYKEKSYVRIRNNLFDTIYLFDSKQMHNTKIGREYINNLNLHIDILENKSQKCKQYLLQNNKNNFFSSCIDYYNTLKNIINIETPSMKEINDKVSNVKATGSGNGGFMFSFEKQDQYDIKVNYNEVGLIIDDQRYFKNSLYLKNKISSIIPEIDAVGESSAPSNIALLKYWGKEKKCQQIATNPSISMTIPGLRTFTKLTCKNGYQEPKSRIDRFLCNILNSDDRHLEINTYNNFPTGTGIASSASGFAAATLAYAKMVNQENNNYFLSHWSRLGSGSACRSIYEDCNDNCFKATFVAWDYDKTYPIKTNMKLSHVIVIFNPFPKDKSSSDGHEEANKSWLFGIRKNLAIENFKILKKAIEDNDFDTTKMITENDTLLMHSIMNSTSFNYISKKTQKFIETFINFRNENNVKAFFTQDAGENTHILYQEESSKKLLSFLQNYPCISLISSNLVRYNFSLERKQMDSFRKIHYYRKGILISGKRYSGKTHLGMLLEKELSISCMFLSKNIKKDYARQNNIHLEDLLNDRKVKEQHRSEMISYAEDKIKEDRFYWCWKLYNSIPDNCRIFTISDARRKQDIEFFAATCNLITIRLECNDEIRKERGWKINNIDNLESESGLDDYANWDIKINYHNLEDSKKIIDNIKNIIYR
jgi:diphosphomevalonate decarboxylase